MKARAIKLFWLPMTLPQREREKERKIHKTSIRNRRNNSCGENRLQKSLFSGRTNKNAGFKTARYLISDRWSFFAQLRRSSLYAFSKDSPIWHLRCKRHVSRLIKFRGTLLCSHSAQCQLRGWIISPFRAPHIEASNLSRSLRLQIAEQKGINENRLTSILARLLRFVTICAWRTHYRERLVKWFRQLAINTGSSRVCIGRER